MKNKDKNNLDSKNTPASIPQKAGEGLGVNNNSVVTKNPPFRGLGG